MCLTAKKNRCASWHGFESSGELTIFDTEEPSTKPDLADDSVAPYDIEATSSKDTQRAQYDLPALQPVSHQQPIHTYQSQRNPSSRAPRSRRDSRQNRRSHSRRMDITIEGGRQAAHAIDRGSGNRSSPAPGHPFPLTSLPFTNSPPVNSTQLPALSLLLHQLYLVHAAGGYTPAIVPAPLRIAATQNGGGVHCLALGQNAPVLGLYQVQDRSILPPPYPAASSTPGSTSRTRR